VATVLASPRIGEHPTCQRVNPSASSSSR
jgi:hypothetical protein